jgi:hypothetical protein
MGHGEQDLRRGQPRRIGRGRQRAVATHWRHAPEHRLPRHIARRFAVRRLPVRFVPLQRLPRHFAERIGLRFTQGVRVFQEEVRVVDIAGRVLSTQHLARRLFSQRELTQWGFTQRLNALQRFTLGQRHALSQRVGPVVVLPLCVAVGRGVVIARARVAQPGAEHIGTQRAVFLALGGTHARRAQDAQQPVNAGGATPPAAGSA